MVRHKFDKDYLLLSFESNNADLETRFRDFTLRSLERSENISNLNDTNLYSFGKVRIRLIGIKNIACSNTLHIRIRSEPFVLLSRKILPSKLENYSLAVHQQLFIPITNRFGKITIELVSSMVHGLFIGSLKEQVIFSCTIPVPKLKERQFRRPLDLKFKLNSKQLDSLRT